MIKPAKRKAGRLRIACLCIAIVHIAAISVVASLGLLADRSISGSWLFNSEETEPAPLPLTYQPTEEEKQSYSYKHVESSYSVHYSPIGTSDGTFKDRSYYQFFNVQYSRDGLNFFHNPEWTPPQDNWVDVLVGNATNYDPPTVMVHQGTSSIEPKYLYHPVHYLSSDQHAPHCTEWIEQPVYLTQVRYSHNIWHTFDEGIMPMLQTMRELGHILLINSISRGDVWRKIDVINSTSDVFEEYAGECAWSVTAEDSTPKQVDCEESLMRYYDVPGKCRTGSSWWCILPGVYNYIRNEAPVLLPFTPTTFRNKWKPLYWAISNNIAEYDSLEGACFKSLVVGRSSVLDFKGHPKHNTPPADFYQHRKNALAIFKRFLVSATMEIGWNVVQDLTYDENPNVESLIEQDTLSGALFQGYCLPERELLRQGIGPEDIELVEVLKPKYPLPYLSASDQAEFMSRVNEESPVVATALAKWMKRRRYLDIEPSLKNLDELILTATAPDNSTSNSRQIDDQTGCLVTKSEECAAVVRPGWNESIQFETNLRRRFVFEKPRPVVTILHRDRSYPMEDRYSREVLNLHDVATYILARYNVTLKVTTFSEPLLETIRLMSHSDVVLGMHGAGWTNLLFVKPGASVLQMYPYGWRRPRGNQNYIRGSTYRLVTEASQCRYMEWGSSKPENAFIRRKDFVEYWANIGFNYTMHPQPDWPAEWEIDQAQPWIYQATKIDMEEFSTTIDELMKNANIRPMITW